MQTLKRIKREGKSVRNRSSVIFRGQVQYARVAPISIYSFIPAVEGKKRYLIDKIYYGTPVSIAEQIYLLCGQRPSRPQSWFRSFREILAYPRNLLEWRERRAIPAGPRKLFLRLETKRREGGGGGSEKSLRRKFSPIFPFIPPHKENYWKGKRKIHQVSV